jgi:hypothetical protein
LANPGPSAVGTGGIVPEIACSAEQGAFRSRADGVPFAHTMGLSFHDRRSRFGIALDSTRADRRDRIVFLQGRPPRLSSRFR